MIRWIVAKTQVEFIHCWPEAPEEVKFLRDPHRHMLHIECKMSVKHNDRDLEFIMVKRQIEELLKNKKWELRTSCEDVAEYLIDAIQYCYGKRKVVVSVFEDGENGAILESEG